MVIMEKPAYIAAPISLVITVACALWYWQMDSTWLGASLIKGGAISVDIILIVIGAFLLITVLNKGGAFSHIKYGISAISRDVRIQTIILAWFFVAFIEGVAGFGTPTMIVAPLMVVLGFSPLSAVVTTLIGDAVAVSYGAVGVPMSIGIGQGVSMEQALTLGPEFVRQTYLLTSVFHVIVGFLMPFIILCVLCAVYRKPIRKAFSAWKLAFLAGLSFVIPSLMVAYIFGPEFPSIVASIVGVAIFIFVVKTKLMPLPDEWIFDDVKVSKDPSKRQWTDYGKALTPYLIILVLLILTRLNIGSLGDMARILHVSSPEIVGTNLEYVFYPLYSSGFVFIVAAAVGFLMYKLSHRHIIEVAKEVSIKVVKTFIALVAVLGIVQIMVNSGHGALGFPSFALQIVNVLTTTGPFWPILSPLIGLFGAFIAGSSTISNLMFSSIQVDVAIAIGMSPIIGLALQAIGSAAGNMIAVHNIIAGSSVVHLGHAEGKVIKYNLIPALGYALIFGLIVAIVVNIL